jgi:flavin-dependent dehydrogenase
MKITNDILENLLDDETFDEFEQQWEKEYIQKSRRNKSMKNPERRDSRKQGRRHIQQARDAKQREAYDYDLVE